MLKRLLVATLAGALFLLAAPTATADGKGNNKSESRHEDEDEDEGDGDGFRFWDDIWHPGIYYGGYHGGGCGFGGLYGKWRSHRGHHGFWRNGDEDDDDDERIFVLPCNFRRGSCYGGGHGYFGRGYYGRGYFEDEGDDGYILNEDGFEPLHSGIGFYGHERYPYGGGCGGFARHAYRGYGVPLVANMSSDQEVPALAQGLLAQGTAYVDIDAASGRVCSSIAPNGVGMPTAAHIHRGTAGVAGPVVADLGTGFRGERTCMAGDPALLQEIAGNPGGFYVNLHTADFPEGAMRGQLAPRPTT
jgi:hypothetical protein